MQVLNDSMMTTMQSVSCLDVATVSQIVQDQKVMNSVSKGASEMTWGMLINMPKMFERALFLSGMAEPEVRLIKLQFFYTDIDEEIQYLTDILN